MLLKPLSSLYFGNEYARSYSLCMAGALGVHQSFLFTVLQCQLHSEFVPENVQNQQLPWLKWVLDLLELVCWDGLGTKPKGR